jgi:hypothetical protein
LGKGSGSTAEFLKIHLIIAKLRNLQDQPPTLAWPEGLGPKSGLRSLSARLKMKFDPHEEKGIFLNSVCHKMNRVGSISISRTPYVFHEEDEGA